MATINLTEGWRIQSDPYSWALARKQRKTDAKTGEASEVWMPKSWHTSPEAAAEYWIEEQLRASKAHSSRELSQERDRLSQIVENAGL